MQDRILRTDHSAPRVSENAKKVMTLQKRTRSNSQEVEKEGD